MSNPQERGGSGPQLLANNRLKTLSNDLIEECKKGVEGSQLPKGLREELESLPLNARRAIVRNLENGCDPLFIACKRGCVEIVQYLVTVCGADIEERCLYEEPDGWPHLVTPLWCAAVSGKLPVVKYLVGIGCNVNAQSDTGSTPVRSACFLTHIEIVQFLVENGADIKIPNKYGSTCLINSVQSADLCRYLISKGADINAKDVEDNTALHHAIKEERHETIRLLLELKNGADSIVTQNKMSNPQERGGSGPQLLANNRLKTLSNDLIEECKKGVEGSQLPKGLREELESLPIDARRAIVRKCENGCNPLFIACKRGCVEIVQYLVTVCGADIEQRCLYEEPDVRSHLVTPLWCAAVSGKLPVVKYLVGIGCNVNAQSDTGSTPVRSACFVTHMEIVQFLVENGADIKIPNKYGSTCLINSVQSADLCRYLISKGADINAKDVEDNTALHHAIKEERHETIRLLLELKNGADSVVRSHL